MDRKDIQTRHNFVGEIRIFSVKISVNPYPSMYLENIHAIHIAMQFAKNRDIMQ